MVSGAWLRRTGPKLTVGLAMIVAVLSVLTGILNIGSQSLVGPLAEFVPREVQRIAGFTGALTGFLMIASALGLRRGLRAAWYSTAVLLPITALQGLLQLSPVSIPLVAVSLLAIPNVIAHRRRFDRELSLSGPQIGAVAAIVGALIYGTVGTYALREEFPAVDTPVDAFYYTLVTASTVGYGDVTPAPGSEIGKLFAMSVLVVGTASFAIALGTLFGPAIEARFEKALGRMTETQLELLEDHLLILGYGDLTDIVLEELPSGVDYVLVTDNAERANVLRERDIHVIVADPSDEKSLERARIGDARAVVVATNDDAEDALAVLTARQLNPDVTIVAAATNRENVSKFHRAGADTVISPASIGGHLLVESAFGRAGVEEVADRIAGEDVDGLDLDDAVPE